MVESELFGYEKGAFTGANEKKVGFFEAADKGTLFLDEIGELSRPAQVKLLRAIQEGEINRVGSTRPIRIDARVISATNRNLIEEVSADRFRSDLFWRLAVAVIYLPPVRERAGDLNLLLDGLLSQINNELSNDPGYAHKNLSSSARNLLLSHPWPGNVREMKNTLTRAAIWSNGQNVGIDDIREALFSIRTNNDADVLNKPFAEGFNISEILSEVARHYLERALNEARGNKTRAAKLLGLQSYQTLSNWLEKYTG